MTFVFKKPKAEKPFIQKFKEEKLFKKSKAEKPLRKNKREKYKINICIYF